MASNRHMADNRETGAWTGQKANQKKKWQQVSYVVHLAVCVANWQPALVLAKVKKEEIRTNIVQEKNSKKIKRIKCISEGGKVR